MAETDVVVIGAGPNGLSLAAHLSAAGIERRVFGTVMGAWRDHMPKGMVLKSEPYASDIAAPVPGFTASDYCRAAGAPYRDRVIPLSRDRFIAYGEWFATSLAGDVEDANIELVTRDDGGFRLLTSSGEQVRARRVVVATGVVPFAYVPPELAALRPSDVSHSSDHTNLSRFRGADVVVVGGGQSALETAALLHECGARPRVVVRSPYVAWHAPNPVQPTWKGRLRRPVARLCEGWHCWAYQRWPQVFRLLPEGERVDRALHFLGPSGAWWLRPRVEGIVPMWIGTTVTGAVRAGTRVGLELWGAAPQRVECDHVIAATGFRFDMSRLSYIDAGLRGSLRLVAGAPLLNRSLESSVPGLYFMGALAAPSLGPSMRFVAGTHIAAARVARSLSRHTGRSRRAGMPVPRRESAGQAGSNLAASA